jgi:hypothetical protein
MALQRTAGNQHVAQLLQGTPSHSAPRTAIQRQKRPGHYTLTQGGNLRQRNSPYDIIRYLPAGTLVEVRDPGPATTKFATNFLGWGAKDHSWSYHVPSVPPFKRRDSPQHGWIVDDNLSPALVTDQSEESSEDEASGEKVTFEMQVRLLRNLVQALITPPTVLSVTVYGSAATAWKRYSRAALSQIVNNVDKQGLFAPNIVNRLVTAQTNPSPLIEMMVKDHIGDQTMIIGDTSANTKSTNWVAEIRSSSSYLSDFRLYFNEETEPPKEEAAKGARFFLGDF